METIESHRLYRSGDILSLDISPPPAQQFFNCAPKKVSLASSLDERLVKFRAKWVPLLQELSTKKFEAFIEISKNGLLHIHAILTVDDPMQLAHQIGLLKYMYDVNTKIDTIADLEIRSAYIRKDYDITKCRITPRTNVDAFTVFTRHLDGPSDKTDMASSPSRGGSSSV